MNTKDRILEAAIDLFSERGFNDVSVREITRAVGIKESSLYNHFTSKQQILDEIFEYLRVQLDKTTLPEEEVIKMIENMTPGEFSVFGANVFKEYMGNLTLMKIWRILSIERFRNEKANEFFKKYLIDNAIEYQSKVFKIMMDKGLIKEFDPKLLAREFYAHTIYLYFRFFEVERDTNPADNPEIQRMVMEHMDFIMKAINK
ncbi:MAG: TetR/AcrR family transcriptional regulator [Clostridia bacterium]|nr:TetR/AcrR family transcriptional regulator [Clostridia bacterium]